MSVCARSMRGRERQPLRLRKTFALSKRASLTCRDGAQPSSLGATSIRCLSCSHDENCPNLTSSSSTRTRTLPSDLGTTPSRQSIRTAEEGLVAQIDSSSAFAARSEARLSRLRTSTRHSDARHAGFPTRKKPRFSNAPRRCRSDPCLSTFILTGDPRSLGTGTAVGGLTILRLGYYACAQG